MKSRLTIAFIGLLLLTACTRSLDNNDPTSIARSGTWRVSLFTDSGNDETPDFSGYIFTFNNNNTITVTRGIVSQNGTWSVNSGKFNIDLGAKIDTNKPLGELTDDWKIISTSATEIKLTDDNSTSAEFLTFTKN